MIGTLNIKATLQPKIGDRDDFIIRAVGPGNTDYSFPLSISRTILSIWEKDAGNCAEALTRCLLRVSGTATPPPEKGFWFDSYNSGDTLQETTDIIANKGIAPFVKGGADQKFVNLFGNTLFSIKNDIDSFFVEKFGHEFFRSFEDAFEESQAIDDLNTPASDHAHFLYRICILSVFIDHINVRLNEESREVLSLKAFENWLAEKTNHTQARELTKTFAMVKNLRKQYPIHETYEVDAEGQRTLRSEIELARGYFNLNDNFEEDWNKVSKRFSESIQKIIKALS